MANILIVEDETSINELIKRTLEMTGHKSFQAYSGREALKITEKEAVDVVLLDINLPDISGFELLRQMPELPIICLTARDEVTDKVRGLRSGAQDYMVKPFDMEELLARIQVILRRFRKEEKLFSFGDIAIDARQHKVWKAQKQISLTSQEYELLLTLVRNKNMALKRSRLLDIAWGMDYDGEERTVDVHIQRIRRKLGLEKELKTIFKYGYRLEI